MKEPGLKSGINVSSKTDLTNAAPSRTKHIIIWLMTIGILFPGAYGFINKLVQFFKTLEMDSGGKFTIIPILNYLIVACGMTCLLIWAVAHGMFRDIEGPKYSMLNREMELERLEQATGADNHA